MKQLQHMLDLFIKIGFLEFDLLDLVDVLVVGLLIYQLYQLLKGSIAFNIFIGLLLVYFVWFIVRLLDMELLQGILGQFIEVGVIALLIVFQPEVRKFLLLLGKGGQFGRFNNLWKRAFSKGGNQPMLTPYVKQITNALENLMNRRTGAIIVLAESSRLQLYANTGVNIDSVISSKLMESIFEKNSPLHDGAIIIAEYRIVAAACILPVSDNPEIPPRLGLRHRAAVGITEQSDSIALVVSEETGQLSYARNGRLIKDINSEEATTLLTKFFESQDA